jgi:hypothetical protein
LRRTVATLLGHAHVGMALDCLGSLLRCSADPLRLRVHEDGSLDQEDRDRLAAGLGEIEFVPRAEADERVADRLAGRPALRELRRRNPLGLKLLDIPMLAEEDDLAYCDADILFLRPFSGLFRFPDAKTGAIFMSDRQNAYSVRSWHLLAHRRLALPCRVNSGLLFFRTRHFDLDLLEWYFARPEFGFAPVCRLWDPQLVRLPEPGETDPGEAVALHFVSPLRSLLPGFLERARGRTQEPPVAAGTVPARRCHSWDLARTEAQRRLAR